MRAMCKSYDDAMQKIVPDREWFFPGRHPDRAIRKVFVDRKFTQFWNKTPFANKVDKKPTVQSLRHTFVVNKMNEWMGAGVDIAVMMPYLSRYLGHSSISDTQYYFHTIEQAFPVIRRGDAVAQRVIPEVVPYED
jgi:integrase